MPIMILPVFIIILSICSLLRNRSQRSYKEKEEAFWEKERRANLVRKQDISNLDYIDIPLDTFPMGQFSDDELASLEDNLSRLSECKILNLSCISNTDLKLQYGAANLNFLSECDSNFTVLARTIIAYGKRLADLGHPREAITVLEFGVACKTDVSSNYTLLASLYREQDQSSKIDDLIRIVTDMDSFLMKDSVLKQLSA